MYEKQRINEVNYNADLGEISSPHSFTKNRMSSKQYLRDYIDFDQIEYDDDDDHESMGNMEINFQNSNTDIILFANSGAEYNWCVRLLSLEKLHILSQYYNAVLSTLGGAYSATRQHQIALIFARKQERVAIRLGKVEDVIKARVWQALNLGLMSDHNSNNDSNNNSKKRRKRCNYLQTCVKIMRFVLQTAKDQGSMDMVAHINNNYAWLKSQLALRNTYYNHSHCSSSSSSSSISSYTTDVNRLANREDFIGS